MDDLISRKDAIDALNIAMNIWSSMPEWREHKIIECLEELPSAQPEKRTNKRTETHACDCISRQDAIDEAVAYIEEWNNAKSEYHKKEITRRFQNLPSAQPDSSYDQGWKDGQEALREEMWERERDRLD